MSTSKSSPLISIAVPVYNEEKNIYNCLKSIFNQDYPINSLEVIVVDDGSTDNTIKIAKQFPIKVISHNSKDPEVGKYIAFKKSSGSLFMYMDADIHLRGKFWFKKMTYPLTSDKNITSSFTKYYSDNHSMPIEKYLNLDPLQRDPIYQFFSPSLLSLRVEKKKHYDLCKYNVGRIPPSGLCLHRRDLIKPLLDRKKTFLELDLLVDLVNKNHKLFAYVPDAGLYHHHARSLADLLKKRSRNVTSVYLKDNKSRSYRWFSLGDSRDLMKIFFWILWSHLFIPGVIIGLYKSFKNRTFIGLYEPIVMLLITDVIVLSFLFNRKGLVFIRDTMRINK